MEMVATLHNNSSPEYVTPNAFHEIKPYGCTEIVCLPAQSLVQLDWVVIAKLGMQGEVIHSFIPCT